MQTRKSLHSIAFHFIISALPLASAIAALYIAKPLVHLQAVRIEWQAQGGGKSHLTILGTQ